MPDVSTLPTLIVQKIIGSAAEPLINSLVTWRDALPLLAVCRSWRIISKPIIYANVFIEGNEMEGVSEHFTHQSRVLGRAINTNIDLVAFTDNSQLVRHIAVEFKAFSCLQALVGSKGIESYLRAKDWSGVNSLSVKLAANYITYGISSDSINSFTLSTKDFCDTLFKSANGITDLVIDTRSTLQPCVAFGEALIQAYLDQLKSFKCSAEMLSNITVIPGRVSKLTIEFDSEHLIPVPKVNATSLVQLEILSAPEDFELEMLVDFEGKQAVEFCNLASLKINYQSSSYDEQTVRIAETPFVRDSTCNPRLLFPKLQKLELLVSSPKLVHKIVCSGKYHWPNVSSLTLYNLAGMFNYHLDAIRRQFELRDTNLTDPRERREYESRIAKCLQQSMSLLTELSFDHSSHELLDNVMYGQVTDYFAERLVSLDIGPKSAFDFPRFSNNLVSLCISGIDDAWLQFPYINTSALQYLQLGNAPFRRFWQIFQNSARSGTLSFDNLVSLIVLFDFCQTPNIDDLKELVEDSREHGALSVLCPKLQSIHISGPHFCGLWNIFSSGQNVWNNVHSLSFTSTSFNLQWTNVVNLLSVEDTAWYVQKLEALNQRISAQAPNVFSLETHLFNTTEESKYPFTALISAYSTQLKRLSCNLPVKLLFPRFSDNLHTLEFAVDERTIAGFPDINTDSLEKLSLRSLPSTFSWNWFKSGNCTDRIRFSKLSSLNLEISGSDMGTSTTPDEPKLEVSMPMLRSAVINIGRHGGASWNAIVRMSNLSSFSFQGAFSGIAAVCRGIEFNHVSSYTMTVVSIGKNDEDAFYETTNRVFSDFDIRNHAGLHLPVLPFDINIDAINWTLLTTLNCRRVQFEKMIQLLPKLANLKRLEYVFVPDYLPDVASIANRDSDQDNTDNYNDSVLSTSVLSLYLSIFRVHVNQGSLVDEEEERAVACCTYLLLLLPHLFSVFINNPINWDTEDIIEGFEDKFPHLSRLRE